jgi:hypothetical protein
MGSVAMIYIPYFIKIGSSIHKLIGGIHRHTDSMEIASNRQRDLYQDLFQKNKGSVEIKQRPIKMDSRTVHSTLSPEGTPFQIWIDE